jgi:hypothetical protein
MADSTDDADAKPETDESPEPFANRAARRAKGKKAGNPVMGTEGRRQIRSGNVQSPRQYGNRRSG